ncbi:hypothetical protein SynPROS71_02279 [Synechococcus sp. PROS-7-1]|nr:hypothetical protein SynPROS71_02279 [Synechococcus sp. PROS-7-1]
MGDLREQGQGAEARKRPELALKVTDCQPMRADHPQTMI